MSSHLFNRLSFESARDVAETLGIDVTAPDSEDLVAALINAFQQIDRLQRRVAALEAVK